MKVVSISKGGVELARGFLTRPMMTIGRAPSCDVVLRAPGVAPVHLLLEWVGQGAFDPSQSRWTMVDVSKSATSGSGIILGSDPASVGDFVVQITEDMLQANPEIGGRIRENLDQSQQRAGSDLLEVVQIKSDSGAVEEVLHLPKIAAGRSKVLRPLRKVTEFQIRWDLSDANRVASVILDEMPGATVIIGTGSEVSLAVLAAAELTKEGYQIRVISMPSTDTFASQDQDYQESVLPHSIKNRVVVEAGCTHYWYQWVGLEGAVIGLDRYGESAPYTKVFEAVGITVEAIVLKVKEVIAKNKRIMPNKERV